MNPLISIIVGFRNRDLVRVTNSLESINNQSYKNFEVIFIDYGSDENTSSQVKQLIAAYSFASYLYNHTEGWLWNRAHALNCGLKRAKGEIVLVYDIDLIIEKNFFSKLSVFNFENFFYTFSCFYLPQNFDVNRKIVERDGIHYDQNYVGLCGVKKEYLDRIDGFDEYFMVWGGEDDDLYLRLSSTGLKRKQIKATDHFVFHQWHPIESPGKPSLWYLTMVNYLYSKKINKVTKPATNGVVFTKAERPVLELIKNESYKEFTKLVFMQDQKFLFFNQAIETFYSLKSGETAFLTYQFYKEENSSFFSWLTNQSLREKEQILQKDVVDFLEYFIGINRSYLADYYFKKEERKLLFVCIKK